MLHRSLRTSWNVSDLDSAFDPYFAAYRSTFSFETIGDRSMFVLQFCRTKSSRLIQITSLRCRLCSRSSPTFVRVDCSNGGLGNLKRHCECCCPLFFRIRNFATLVPLHAVYHLLEVQVTVRNCAEAGGAGCTGAGGNCWGSVGFQADKEVSKKMIRSRSSGDSASRYSTEGATFTHTNPCTRGKPRCCHSNLQSGTLITAIRRVFHTEIFWAQRLPVPKIYHSELFAYHSLNEKVCSFTKEIRSRL